jgi:hypothetical protein
MFDLKPYGAFVENTVRPLIAELAQLGLRLDEKSLNSAIWKAGIFHVISTFLAISRDIIICLIILKIVCKT